MRRNQVIEARSFVSYGDRVAGVLSILSPV